MKHVKYDMSNNVSRYYTQSDTEWQGCGVGVVVSEGFSTWGVGVAENFNDSDSGQTFAHQL